MEMTVVTKVAWALLLPQKNRRNQVLPAAPLHEEQGLELGCVRPLLQPLVCTSAVNTVVFRMPSPDQQQQPPLGTLGIRNISAE